MGELGSRWYSSETHVVKDDIGSVSSRFDVYVGAPLMMVTGAQHGSRRWVSTLRSKGGVRNEV